MRLGLVEGSAELTKWRDEGVEPARAVRSALKRNGGTVLRGEASLGVRTQSVAALSLADKSMTSANAKLDWQS